MPGRVRVGHADRGRQPLARQVPYAFLSRSRSIVYIISLTFDLTSSVGSPHYQRKCPFIPLPGFTDSDLPSSNVNAPHYLRKHLFVVLFQHAQHHRPYAGNETQEGVPVNPSYYLRKHLFVSFLFSMRNIIGLPLLSSSRAEGLARG